MINSYTEAKFKDGSRIMRADAPFDEARAALYTNKKFPINYLIEVTDLAFRRMQFPKEHSLNQHGSFTRSDFLYAKRAEGLLVLDGPLSTDKDLAQQATEANRQGRYFTTPKKDLYDKFEAIAKEDAKDRSPEERRVLILPSRTRFLISQTQNPEFSKGLLRESEKDYIPFTGNSYLMVYPVAISEIDSQAGTLVTKCWLHSLPDGSFVDGDRGLDHSNRVRGVFVAGGASAQKISEEPEVKAYTPEQVEKFKSILQGVRTRNIKASELKKLLSIIEALPTKR